jgi:acyl phosphate:glycerol-3-phosphate acyltransferase
MAAAVGHIWPLFAQFRGGKGLAASLGALLWTSLPLTAVTAAAILPFWGMSRSLYMGVSAAALLLPLSCWWQFRSLSAVAAGAAWGGVVLWAHRRDIRDYLQARRERRAG